MSAAPAGKGARASRPSNRPVPREPGRRSRGAQPSAGRGTGSRFTGAGAVSWSPIEALTVLAVVAAGFLGKDALLHVEWLHAGVGGAQMLLRVLVLAVFYAVQVALLAYFAKRRDIGLGHAFGLRVEGARARTIALSVALVAVLLVLTRLAATVYGALAQAAGFHPPVKWNADLTHVFGNDTVGLVLTVAMVVIVGPAVEELVFRGVVLRAASARLPTWPAVLLSAAVFSAYHFTAWMLFPAFVLGVALGWLAARRETLWPAIALHSLYNAVAVAAAFYVAAR